MAAPAPREMPSDGLKIGDLARRLDMAPSAIRFYEDRGLLAPRRTAGGTRRYGAADVERLRLIRELAALDLPLDLVRDLVAARPRSDTGDDAARRLDDALGGLWAEVERKMRAARFLLDRLAAARSLNHRCLGCRKPPRADTCAACPASAMMLGHDLVRFYWDRGAGDEPAEG
ncbi:MAG: MerR family transcriptional regulator [Hyphomicrobiales bacterium]|nr:MerR family transcriptional regulator [Hyphomicrobiales bacterium]